MLLRATTKVLLFSSSLSNKIACPLICSTYFPFSSKKPFAEKLKEKKRFLDSNIYAQSVQNNHHDPFLR